jgi:alkylation response protein AidB-like acyl-CoA dehydrogenase
VSFDPTTYLPDDLLERIRERAPIHDRENTFPDQDLAELRDAGYLRILVPAERGGSGLGLEQAALLQQRLAGASPATALAINMHLVWTGVAKVFSDRGVPGLEFVQDGAVAGDVFAFGISEGGNDLVLFDSNTDAAPQPDGSYSFTGTKIFTSLAPVWTKLGLHGLDTTSEDAPKLVFAFIERTDAVTTSDDWDTLGMRGTQSRTTRLDGAVAPASQIVIRSSSASSACSSCCSRRSTPASPAARSSSPSRLCRSARRRRRASPTPRMLISAGALRT